ncbi:MAG: hypothetical protein KY461_09290 [Actinobacteria bacterium]|nr:hypothetical protein [Actinomycetota bacterium]
MRNFIALLFGAALLVAATIPVTTPGEPAPLPVLDAVAENLELVGHSSLGDRGMNAALAVHGDVAYVGSRTDGKPRDENALGAGILIVDVSDPTAPTVVGEVDGTGREGETSREMRIWPEQDLLIVQNLTSNCSPLIHACSVRGPGDNFTFYDIAGENALDPQPVAEYRTDHNPHEFFLWVDPADRDRALLYVSGTSDNRFMVVDVSGAREGTFETLVDMDLGWLAPGGDLHSMTPTVDGRTTYFAYLTGGFYVADTSEVAEGHPSPTVALLTPPDAAPTWPGPGAHSALEIPGTGMALVTDEVYGEALRFLGGHGCPWGWVRMLDVSNPAAPEVVNEYKLPQNEADFCDTDAPRLTSSYSAHNPTVTEDLAFISWHAAGLQVLDLADPRNPAPAGQFVPSPLPLVLQEDPALTSGQDKVAMWSFPIIKDGLVYVVDIRNGLYILEYTGPRAETVAAIDFLEGNSNLGDALELGQPAE